MRSMTKVVERNFLLIFHSYSKKDDIICTMFSLFIFIISALSGFLAYSFADKYLQRKGTLTFKQELITKVVFASLGALAGLILGSLLYLILKAAIGLVIFFGTIALVVWIVVLIKRLVNKEKV